MSRISLTPPPLKAGWHWTRLHTSIAAAVVLVAGASAGGIAVFSGPTGGAGSALTWRFQGTGECGKGGWNIVNKTVYYVGSGMAGSVVAQVTVPASVKTLTHDGLTYDVGPIVPATLQVVKGSAPQLANGISTGVTVAGNTVTVDYNSLWSPQPNSTWVLTLLPNSKGYLTADPCLASPTTLKSFVHDVFRLSGVSYTGDPATAIASGVPMTWWFNNPSWEASNPGWRVTWGVPPTGNSGTPPTG